jgi:hypothetical protein
VREKFRELDADGDWTLSKAELLENYTPDAHRDVKTGIKSRKRVKAELLEAFQLEGKNCTSRKEISFEDWAAYHNENLSEISVEMAGDAAAVAAKELDALWPSTKVLAGSASRKSGGHSRAHRERARAGGGGRGEY